MDRASLTGQSMPDRSDEFRAAASEWIVLGLEVIEMQRREFIGLLGGDAASPFALAARKDGLGEEPCARSVLFLLSIAIMALLLTDADAKRRSSAQGSQAAGANRSWCAVHPRHGGENCGYTSFDQCWATIGSEGGWCRPNPFPGTPFGTGYTWSPGPSR